MMAASILRSLSVSTGGGPASGQRNEQCELLTSFRHSTEWICTCRMTRSGRVLHDVYARASAREPSGMGSRLGQTPLRGGGRKLEFSVVDPLLSAIMITLTKVTSAPLAPSVELAAIPVRHSDSRLSFTIGLNEGGARHGVLTDRHESSCWAAEETIP
jgi:hypothetical protein